MPHIRAEQLFGVINDTPSEAIDHRISNAHIANAAGIKQSKIEDWGDDPAGWISQGVIKPVTTANLPTWDGSQAGEMYYDTNTNELFLGISSDPYYQIILGSSGVGGFNDKILVIKEGYEGEDWDGANDTDPDGVSTIFALDTDEVVSNGSNLTVYLNGILQERGSGNDYTLYEEGGVDKIQFTYDIEGFDQKVTAIINSDETLVNYATKAYVDGILMDATAHDHNGSGSPQLDFNEAITIASLAAIQNSILPNTTSVHLGSASNKFGEIHAVEGHFDASSIYLGNVALSGTGDTFLVSKDAGTTYFEVAVAGSTTAPINLAAGAGQEVILESDTGIIANGDILPEMTGATGNVSIHDVGGATKRFDNIYADKLDLSGDVLISGNLTVAGTTTQINTETLTVDDNILVLNNNVTGTPTEDAGIEIERGTSTSAQILWDESADLWKAGEWSALRAIATREDAPTDTGVAFYDDATGLLTTSSSLTWDGATLTGAFTGAVTGTASNASQLGGEDPSYYSISTHSHLNATLPAKTAGDASVGFVTYNSTSPAGGQFYGGTTDPANTNRLNYDGYFYATRVYNAVYNDIAEFMVKAEEAEAGQCMVMTDNGLVPSKKRADKAVVGIFSDSFGYALGAEDQDNKLPIGIAGRVWAKIKEPVEIGDLLVSDIDGFVSKATPEELMIPGIKVGKVLKSKTDDSVERIEILIMNI